MIHLSKMSLALVVLAMACPVLCRADEKPKARAVEVQENRTTFTLSNGIVQARVSKRSGDLTSLRYNGMEILTNRSGHAGAYRSHDTTGGKKTVTRITINPKANGGRRGEVSIKGISGGRKMGHGPGAGRDGDFPADIEICYSPGHKDLGIYTYCTFNHLPTYPAATMTEARFCAKLDAMFDWMTLDNKRSQNFPATLREDKYVYTVVQYDHPVYGWSSSNKQIGFWLINPSGEYLSGGPTRVKFLCHRDTTRVAAPCVLNYWRSSHYGGTVVAVGGGERWTKVIGPFFLYVNSGGNPQTLWKKATAQSAREAAGWPYEWVAGVDYPHRKERGKIKGQLILNDPQRSKAKMPGLLVGLTHPTYRAPGSRRFARTIDWLTDARHYQFWVRGNENGSFSIPNVRAGKYTLRAFADGILGEYAKADVTAISGKAIDLGKLKWTPIRDGKQLWDIGIPNRNGTEFFKGESFADLDISLKYAKLFPKDVNYVIGKSDFRKDWFFQHVPHNEDPKAKAVPYAGVRSRGRATPFAIHFDMPNPPQGKATLRVAICGTGARTINVTANGKAVGRISRLRGDGAITRPYLWLPTQNYAGGSASMKKRHRLRHRLHTGSIFDC